MIDRVKIALVGIIALSFGWWFGAQFGPEGGEWADVHTEHELDAHRWTCSMHPQIRQPSPGLCPVCAMELIAVESEANPVMGSREIGLSEDAQKLAEVQTAIIERRFADVETRMVGKIAIDETRLRDVTAWVPGRIERLYVDYTGVQINRGDHMVSIYSPELLTAQQELLQAVRALAKLDENSVSSLQKTAALTVASARQKLRLWGLTPAQIAQIETDRTPSDYLTIYAPESGVVVERHVGQGAYVQTGERIYTTADLSHLWLRLEAYESDLQWIQYGQVVEFTAASYPGERFAGRISFIDPLLDEKTRTIGVRVNVDNADGRLKPGMLVRALARAQIAADGKMVNASLVNKWISPMHPEIIKEQPGACDVCGMALVRADSLGYKIRQADAPLLLPASAPLLTGKRAIVYVAVPDRAGHYEGREVELGSRAGDYYIVQSGLRAGDQVVVNGAFKIDSALQIQAKPSMMSSVDAVDDASLRETDANEVLLERSLMRIFIAYLMVQEGLSSDQFQATMVGARALHAAVGNADVEEWPDALRRSWERASLTVKRAVDTLSKSSDIGAARMAFAPLSEAVLTMADEMGTRSEHPLGLYQCPMARSGEGALWIQRVGAVANPYFGASMLRCGSQQRSLTTWRE